MPLKTLIAAIIAILTLHASPRSAQATMKTGLYAVSGHLIIVADIGGNDTSVATRKGRELARNTPMLSEKAVQHRCAEYLMRNLSPEVREAVEIVEPERTYDWPISTAAMIVKVDYMVRVLEFDGHEHAVGSLTARPLFSLSDVPGRAVLGRSHVTGLGWRRVVSFHVSDDPEQLEKNLDEAIDVALKPFAVNLYTYGTSKKDENEVQDNTKH